MGSRIIFISLALAIIAAGLLFWLAPGWPVYAALALATVLLALLWRSVVMPKRTVMHGMELIAAQDFNNRLTTVGERDADRIVKLFNTMIDRLRNERLENLERESFLNLLVDASPMGVAMKDFDGRISMVNKAFVRLIGKQDPKDILGKKLNELDFDLRDGMLEVPLGENMVIRRGDVKMYRCYHLSFVKEGFPREFYLLESLTEEVMKAEKSAYEKVIRIISHEVNNTMGGVRSVLETLADINADDEDVCTVIESCENRCASLCDFISSYADVVKVPQPVLREENVNALLSALLPFLLNIAGDGIGISLDAGEDVGTVMLDKTLMEQVIVNVVKNAAESIRSSETLKPMIAISAIREKSHIILEIANNGLPITDEVSRQLFSPFFTTKRQGRGLGLTLVSEILNRHGANYSLRTGTDGITRFRIEF